MSDVAHIIEAGLVALGATGLVNTETPCGCGLDDLMPCDEPCPDCRTAYAVLCDGTNCPSCEARPFPPREDWENVCYVTTAWMDDPACDAMRRYPKGGAMTHLERIKAALEAKREAAAALAAWHDPKPSPPWTDRQIAEYGWLADEAVRTSAALHALLTDDTIAALVAVAEAAEEHLSSHHHGRGDANHGLAAALAPLVKEVEDDRA